MKNLFLAAVASLSLAAAVVPAANAALHSGPYDNTGHGPQQTGQEGGSG